MTFLKIVGIMALMSMAVVLFFILIAVATKIICWIYEKCFYEDGGRRRNEKTYRYLNSGTYCYRTLDSDDL